MVEDTGLSTLSLGDQIVLEELDDLGADVAELLLDLLGVVSNEGDVLLVSLGLLLITQ